MAADATAIREGGYYSEYTLYIAGDLQLVLQNRHFLSGGGAKLTSNSRIPKQIVRGVAWRWSMRAWLRV